MAAAGGTSHRKSPRNEDASAIHTLSIHSEDDKKDSGRLFQNRWFLWTPPAPVSCLGLALGTLVIVLLWNGGRSIPPSLDLRQLAAMKAISLERTQAMPAKGKNSDSGQHDNSAFSGAVDFETLMQERAVNNQIILVIATSSYQTLTLNLICSLKKLKITNFIIGALESSVFELMRSLGYPVFEAFENSVLGGDEVKSAWDRREGFRRVNVVKEEVIAWALEAGYEVILTDADVVWRKKPFDDLAVSCKGFDFCFQTAVVNEDGNSDLNGGFINIKPTAAAITAQKTLVGILSENIALGDQQEFRKMLCDGSKRTSNTTCEDPITGASTKMLPVRKYAKSALLFSVRNAKNALKSMDPFTMHYNSGLPDKKERVIRDQGLWKLNAKNHCI